MNRKILLWNFLFSGFIFQAFNSFSQEYPQVRIDPWTTKSGEKSTYYSMLDWDTSPYKEFTYLKRSGPNKWEITEYMNFRMLFPKGYDASTNNGKKYPMIIFLHGAGESGVAWTNNYDYVNGYRDTPPEPEKIDNNDHQLKFGGKEFLAARNRAESDARAFNGFFVFPQVPFNGSWASDYDAPISSYNRQVAELAEKLSSQYDIDVDRIYIMGLSNGARGVWDLVNRRPDLFAAGICFSGLGSLHKMPENLAHFPIWVFQGGRDINPAPSGTYQLIEAIEKEGGDPRLTVYDSLEHNVWERAFTEPGFFSWLLTKSKLSIHTYYQKNHFDKLDSIEALLGISPGFNQYQWKHNGEVILNDNAYNLMAEHPGAYQVRIQRGEQWSEWSDPVFITSTEKEPDKMLASYRINIGANQIDDEGKQWEEDSQNKPSIYLKNNTSTPSLLHTEAPFYNYTDAPNILFESGRILHDNDELHYAFPAQGMTEVTIYFSGISQEKEGRLDIILEEQTVLNDFNIQEESGKDAMKKSFSVTVEDGTLDVKLYQEKGTATISGIKINLPNSITGVLDNQTHLYVMPNPFSNYLSIFVDNENIEKLIGLALYDATGKPVFKDESSSGILKTDDLTPLPSGLYFLKVELRGEKSQTFKVIKK